MAAGNVMQTPPFLTKLYQLVNDPQTSALVSWTDEKGLSFTVHKPSEFGRDILPRYFKHNNFSSFVRQLNQYGFHKQNSDKWMFGHDSFRKDRPDLLKNITRRRPKQTPPTSNAVLPHALAQKAIVELGNYGIEGEVKALKRDKDLLIQELVVTRRNEEQLRNKCTSLESRVTNLEDSSKQMQAFIMHYFSQVLQPYSQAMASRKRKRLPPSSPSSDTMDILVEPQQSTVANVSHSSANPSVDALRAMMQQMGVGMPPNPSVPRSTNANSSIVERPTDGRAYAPAMIQELPQDDQMNGTSTTQPKKTIHRAGPPSANGNPPRASGGRTPLRSAATRTTPQLARHAQRSTAPQAPQLDVIPPSSSSFAPPSPVVTAKSLSSAQNTSAIANPIAENLKAPTALANFASVNSAPSVTDPALIFLDELPNTPSSSMTMDLIETVLNEPKDRQTNDGSMYGQDTATTDGDFNPPDYEITFNTNETNDSQMPTCSSSKDDEKTLEQFLELTGDDQPLPPPLTHLPEGTDIHALAKRIESFAESTDD